MAPTAAAREQTLREARLKLKGQGQISDFEGRMLASSVSAIDRAAGPDVVRRHLQNIVRAFEGDSPFEGAKPERGGSDLGRDW